MATLLDHIAPGRAYKERGRDPDRQVLHVRRQRECQGGKCPGQADEQRTVCAAWFSHDQRPIRTVPAPQDTGAFAPRHVRVEIPVPEFADRSPPGFGRCL